MSDLDANGSRRPRILLAEDDPVSAAFLGDALQALGTDVVNCSHGKAALDRARAQRFELLLLDCHLPGLDACQILQALKDDPDAASQRTPVLATSADVTPAMDRQMRAMGCAGLLSKPLQVDDLDRALRQVLASPARQVMDDRAGLDASGSMQNLYALRGLFASELDDLTQELDVLADDPTALHDRLHRLRASCGFCGARALAVACGDLSRAIASGDPPRVTDIDAFRRALHATQAALLAEAGKMPY